MRLLPSGSTALVVELGQSAEVMAFYSALLHWRPEGVLDIVPAARTILLVIDPQVTTLAALTRAVRSVRPDTSERTVREIIEVPVIYDGEDLAYVASFLGCSEGDVVRQHTACDWTVAFCGFAPGFGYMATSAGGWDVPRRSQPRTKVPSGAVAVAGGFTAIYPRASAGGWQLLGRTNLPVFDLQRDPPALFRPGVRVRYFRVDHFP